MNPIHQCFQKISNGNFFFNFEKGLELLQYLVDFTLNRTWPMFYNYIPVYKITLIFSKDIERKPFFKVKKGHNSQIFSEFYPKLNLTTFYDYIPVYKIRIQYTNLFKRYRMETIFVTYETDGRDSGDTIKWRGGGGGGGGIKLQI